MSIYQYDNYRKFLKDQLKLMPKKGYGQLSRLAKHLGINSAYLSQIFQETKSFSQDQALAAASFFNLGEMETEYLLTLVQLDKAGSKELKNFLLKKINKLQEESQKIRSRVTVDTQLSPIHQGIFYSDWAYSAVRQATTLISHQQIEGISQLLGLSSKRVSHILEFLVQTGLCKIDNNQFKIGDRRTHLDAESPLVKLHHQNWRAKAVEQIYDSWENKLHFTSPMTISNSHAKKIREMLVDFIEQVGKVADSSTSEELVCFNADWFRSSKK